MSRRTVQQPKGAQLGADDDAAARPFNKGLTTAVPVALALGESRSPQSGPVDQDMRDMVKRC